MAKRKKQFETREQYLVSAAKRMDKELFAKKTEVRLPEQFFVSVMEPAGKVIGRAYPPSQDSHHMFVSATLEDPVQVLATLLHEMIHLAVGTEHGHKKPFATPARAVGLEGKLTATVPGEELSEYLKKLDEELAGYPHRPLIRKTKSVKRTGRVKLVSTEEPGYSLYITPALLEMGYPVDPWGKPMEEA